MLENDDNTILKKPRDEDSDALLQERKDVLQTVIITNSLSETKSINNNLQELLSDNRIGFPIKKPNISLLNHGWFWVSNSDVIKAF